MSTSPEVTLPVAEDDDIRALRALIVHALALGAEDYGTHQWVSHGAVDLDPPTPDPVLPV